MSPLTRRNSALSKKIAALQLRLAPLVPLPSGPPHPSFPKTLLAFHLLSEDELDSIAHYYHQSTPGPWTQHYPASMNWDKDFLARPAAGKRDGRRGSVGKWKEERRLSQSEEVFLEGLMETVADLSSPPPLLASSLSQNSASPTAASPRDAGNPYAGLSDKDRIRIKRRKIGKFIGLVGMETPVEEIAGRIRASLDAAVEKSRDELRRNEEVMLRRKKMA